MSIPARPKVRLNPDELLFVHVNDVAVWGVSVSGGPVLINGWPLQPERYMEFLHDAIIVCEGVPVVVRLEGGPYLVSEYTIVRSTLMRELSPFVRPSSEEPEVFAVCGPRSVGKFYVTRMLAGLYYGRVGPAIVVNLDPSCPFMPPSTLSAVEVLPEYDMYMAYQPQRLDIPYGPLTYMDSEGSIDLYLDRVRLMMANVRRKVMALKQSTKRNMGVFVKLPAMDSSAEVREGLLAILAEVQPNKVIFINSSRNLRYLSNCFGLSPNEGAARGGMEADMKARDGRDMNKIGPNRNGIGRGDNERLEGIVTRNGFVTIGSGSEAITFPQPKFPKPKMINISSIFEEQRREEVKDKQQEDYFRSYFRGTAFVSSRSMSLSFPFAPRNITVTVDTRGSLSVLTGSNMDNKVYRVVRFRKLVESVFLSGSHSQVGSILAATGMKTAIEHNNVGVDLVKDIWNYSGHVLAILDAMRISQIRGLSFSSSNSSATFSGLGQVEKMDKENTDENKESMLENTISNVILNSSIVGYCVLDPDGKLAKKYPDGEGEDYSDENLDELLGLDSKYPEDNKKADAVSTTVAGNTSNGLKDDTDSKIKSGRKFEVDLFVPRAPIPSRILLLTDFVYSRRKSLK